MSLFTAIEDGDVARLRASLAHGEDPNRRHGEHGSTPLAMVAGGNKEHPGSTLPMLNLLLQHGADVHATCEHGPTALHQAARHEHVHQEACVAALLHHGADVDALDAQGRTPLMYAASTFEASYRVLYALLEAGANPKHLNCGGTSAVSLAQTGGTVTAQRLRDAIQNLATATALASLPVQAPSQPAKRL